ncbi:hypothetical protein [Curtobacterium sp. ME12]|uniref:hypothetical protein n=1 Tax=Curtobacterium sp. ME12 TaxID=2744253 RepID=UPI0039886CC3
MRAVDHTTRTIAIDFVVHGDDDLRRPRPHRFARRPRPRRGRTLGRERRRPAVRRGHRRPAAS